MKIRASLCTLGVIALALVGCKGTASTPAAPAGEAAAKAEAAAEAARKEAAAKAAKAKAAAEAAAAKAAEEAKGEEIFDPAKPPAGYVNCHRNHCHKVGGGVASYAQVMAEMGATKITGAAERQPMPAAPADVAAPPADAEKTASGLASKVLEASVGSTVKPTATSVVTVHYTGWTTDGKAFDSSVARGRPATFPLNRVIAGWTEGLQLMTVGESRRFWIPEELAYKGRPGRPAGMLVFDVELLEIREGQ